MRKTDERIAIDQKALGVLQNADLVKSLGDTLKHVYVDIWKARNDGYVSPALLRAMVHASLLDPSEVAAVLTVEVPPCPECGEAHTVPWCTDQEGEPVKAPYNRKRPKRKHPPTLKIRTDNVDSAANSIFNSYPKKHELLALLSLMWQLEEERQRLSEAATEE